MHSCWKMGRNIARPRRLNIYWAPHWRAPASLDASPLLSVRDCRADSIRPRHLMTSSRHVCRSTDSGESHVRECVDLFWFGSKADACLLDGDTDA